MSRGSLYPDVALLAAGCGHQRKLSLDNMKGGHMQKLVAGSKHIAEWGGYQVVIDLRQEPLLLIRDSSPPYRQYFEEVSCRDGTDAIMTAGAWLERRGCFAFVDGKRRNLSNFLVFIPDGVS